MSTSGSFNTSAVGNFYFTFDWYRTGYDSSRNVHYIHYTLTAHNTPGKYRTVYLKNLYVAGNQVFYQAGTAGNGKAYYDGNVVTSGDMTIGSYNNAGDGSFSASFEAGVGQYPSANCSGSSSWNLDRIPRYLNNINIYNNGSALNSISVRWTCDPNRDWTQYSLNGGAWTDAGDSVASDGKSGTFNIGGLAPNTSYNVRVRLRRADSGLWSESGTISITTKNKAVISSPNDNFSINNGNAITVQCNNPSGNQIAYFLDCPSGTRRLTSGKTTNTSYTWTAAQVLSMLQYFPNANASSIKVGVITYGNSEYYSEKVGTLNVVNSNPVFSNFVYEDTNAETIRLTGGNQTIIKGYSNVKATISNANKATAKNYATMSKYRFVVGSKQLDINYSDNASVSGTINKADNNIFNMYAIDSRGNSTIKQISPSNYLNYEDIVIKEASAIRTGGVGSETTLAFSGSYWGYGFGALNNAITSCYYEYKKTTSDTWIKGGDLTPILNGNDFSFSGIIKGDSGAEGFSITNSFNIRIIIKDRLSTSIFTMTLGTGIPSIAITKDGVAINGMYNNSLKGALQIWNGDVYINGKKLTIN